MLRLGAIVAGALGVAAAIAGSAGLVARPDAVVWASAPLDRPVVVIPPQVLAMEGVLDIVVEAEPYTEIRTALPEDVYAWLRGESSIVVRGVSSWTDVTLVRPDIYTYDGNERTGDIWRSNVTRFGAMHIRPAEVPPGLAVVIITRSHTPLDTVSLQLSRDPGYDWALPTLSAGALLAAVSISLFAFAWLAPARAPEGPHEVEVVAPEPEPKPKEPKSKGRKPKERASTEDEPEDSDPKDAGPPTPTAKSLRSRRAHRVANKEAEK